MPLFVTNAIDNLPLPLYGDGLQMRDYQYVRDHCEGIEAVLRRGQPGEIYNLGTGTETTNIKMARLILKLLNKPESLIQPITDRPGHDRRYALDCSKVKSLGWESKHNFEQAIEATVKWYVDHESWWRKDVQTKLAKHDISFSGVSFPKISKDDAVINTNLCYYRFHGVPKLFYSEYEPEFVEKIYKQIRKSRKAKTAFIYFNNTASVAALHNARQLLALVKGRG